MADGDTKVSVELKRATLSAVITRADGTVETLGVISDSEYQKPTSALRRLLKKVS